MVNTVEAATTLGQVLAFLANEGVCDTVDAGMALMNATPMPGPERSAALNTFRECINK